ASSRGPTGGCPSGDGRRSDAESGPGQGEAGLARGLRSGRRGPLRRNAISTDAFCGPASHKNTARPAIASVAVNRTAAMPVSAGACTQATRPEGGWFGRFERPPSRGEGRSVPVGRLRRAGLIEADGQSPTFLPAEERSTHGG